VADPVSHERSLALAEQVPFFVLVDIIVREHVLETGAVLISMPLRYRVLVVHWMPMSLYTCLRSVSKYDSTCSRHLTLTCRIEQVIIGVSVWAVSAGGDTRRQLWRVNEYW
jgi:hypothetical protein